MQRFLTLVLAFLPFALAAQDKEKYYEDEYPAGLYAGATTGLNTTWVLVDDTDLPDNKHFDYKTTFHTAPFGLVLGYKFNQHHSVQLEAFYSKQGADFDLLDDNSRVVGEKRIDLRYWALPLLFKFTTGGNTRFNVHIGPQFAFLKKGREENEYYENVTARRYDGTTRTYPQGIHLLASSEQEDRQRYPGIGGFNSFDPSLCFGFGLEQNLTRQLYFSANLRFNYSFREIRDTGRVEDLLDMDKHQLRTNLTGGVQAGIHYIFSNK